MFAIDAYENDPGGPSVVDAREWVLQYDAHRACWWDVDEGSSSATAPCVTVPMDKGWGTYEFFYLYDQAQYCEVRFRMCLGFKRVPLASLEA